MGEELKSLLRIEDPCSPDAAPLDDLAYRRRTPHVQDEDVRVVLSHKKTFLVPGAVEDGTPCFLSIVNRHVVRDCPAGEAGMYAEYSFRRIANLLDREGYEQTVFIFDFQHFSWDNLDTRTAAATLKQGQDYHPERLKKAILFKAPTLFWTLWKLITPLMDAKTKSKFVFANNAEITACRTRACTSSEHDGGRVPRGGLGPHRESISDMKPFFVLSFFFPKKKKKKKKKKS